MLFTGLEEYQMDDRRRVPIPPRFRGAFDPGVVIAAGPREWIELLTTETFERLKTAAESWPDTAEGALARLHFFGNAHEDKRDGQGRVSIPEHLAELAGLASGNRVVVVGAGDRLQIWDRERFRAGEAERRTAREAVMNAVAASRALGGA